MNEKEAFLNGARWAILKAMDSLAEEAGQHFVRENSERAEVWRQAWSRIDSLKFHYREQFEREKSLTAEGPTDAEAKE